MSQLARDLDIYRSAHAFMRRHGEDASFHAAQQADRLLDAGDIEGAATWRRIVAAIEEMERQEPGQGEQVH